MYYKCKILCYKKYYVIIKMILIYEGDKRVKKFKKILLVFSIILLGVIFCYNRSYAEDNLVDSMSNLAKQTFNNKFTKYEGQQRGSIIKSLYQEVQSNNANSEVDKKVKININADEIETNSTYKVGFNYDSDGYLNEVIVTKISENDTLKLTQSENKDNNTNNIILNTSIKNETSSKNETLPKTGISNFYWIGILLIGTITIVMIFEINKYKDVK